MTKKASPEPRLEQQLGELEKIIAAMEQKNLSLEESLVHFETGMRLVRESHQMLSQAEQKIQVLLQRPEGPQLSSFDEPGEG